MTLDTISALLSSPLTLDVQYVSVLPRDVGELRVEVAAGEVEAVVLPAGTVPQHALLADTQPVTSWSTESDGQTVRFLVVFKQ